MKQLSYITDTIGFQYWIGVNFKSGTNYNIADPEKNKEGAYDIFL